MDRHGEMSLLDRVSVGWPVLARYAAPIVYLEWAVWVGLVVLNSADIQFADSTTDWLVASAASQGVDPRSDLRELSARFDIPYVTPPVAEVLSRPWIHPRTPASLLILQPATLFGPEQLREIVVALSLVTLGVIGVRFIPRVTGWAWPTGLVLAVLLLLSGPVIRGLQFGSWSLLLAGMIAYVWWATRETDSRRAGAVLGLAISLRLFPALLLVPLVLRRRWRTVVTAVVVGSALTGLGMLAFDLSIAEAVSSLSSASDTWLTIGSNASLARPLFTVLGVPPIVTVIALSLVAAIVLWRIDGAGAGRFDVMLSVTVVAMVLAAPLSWEHYDAMLLLPLGVLIGTQGNRSARVSGWLWLGVITLGYFLRQPWESAFLDTGSISFGGRLILVAGVSALITACLREPRERLPSIGVVHESV